MKKTDLLVYVFILFLTACVTNPNNNFTMSNTGLVAIKTSVHFLASDRTYLPKKYFTKSVLVYMPYIPGAIFGNPGFKPIYAEILPKNLSISLDLTKLIPALNADARPLSRLWLQQGISVYPEKTKLARIGTFAFDMITKKSIGGVGFLDPVSKESLILVYVDRACKITGRFTVAGATYEHNIDFPGSGFHFIRVNIIQPQLFRLHYFPKNGAVDFVIFVKNTVQPI